MTAYLTAPIDSFAFEVPGTIDALGELTLTDDDGQARDDVTIGLEDHDPLDPVPLRLEAADLEPLGGSLVGDNIEGVTSPDWTALAATGEQPHTGQWRVYGRIEVEANVSGIVDSTIRLFYRSGDGSLGQTDRPVVTPHLADELIEVDLGLINVREGESWLGQVEIKGKTAGLDVKLRELLLVPATKWARVSAPLNLTTPTTLDARDEFDQGTGALSGETLPSGGTWAGAGDGDDFAIGLGVASRSAVSDTGGAAALQNGRFVLAPPDLTDTLVKADLRQDAVLVNTGSPNVGVVARYADINNWIVAMILRFSNPASTAQSGTYAYLYKRIAGGTPELVHLARALPTADKNKPHTLRLLALSTGIWAVWLDHTGGQPGAPVMGGHDSDLEAGGALDEGKIGLFDWHPSAPAVTRIFDSFAAWSPDVDHVVHPDQSLRITHEKAERENAAGTDFGRVPRFEGARLKIPPSTRNDLMHRLVVKQDRNDLTQLPVGDPSAVNLVTNPSAATDTTGWTNQGLATFARTTSPPAGGPASTGFHGVGDASGDAARDEVAVENGKTYRLTAWVYLDTNTASGLRLDIRDSGSITEAETAIFSTLDAWTELTVTATADESANWQFRIRQAGAGATDFYFAGVAVRELDRLSAALTVTPRVALVSA